jgi:hypothetical protein
LLLMLIIQINNSARRGLSRDPNKRRGAEFCFSLMNRALFLIKNPLAVREKSQFASLSLWRVDDMGVFAADRPSGIKMRTTRSPLLARAKNSSLRRLK